MIIYGFKMTYQPISEFQISVKLKRIFSYSIIQLILIQLSVENLDNRFILYICIKFQNNENRIA